MRKILKILLVIMIIIISNSLILINTVQAVENKEITLHYLGQFNRILKYNGMLIKTSHVVSEIEGKQYPAYCLNVELQGVDENTKYNVEKQEKITDLGLWKVIINGYPYKSLEQLGVANEEEAYIATKQSIYCYLYNRGTEKYVGVGEAGQRTWNAMNIILENAKKSTENFDNTIIVNQSEDWEVDKINMQYITKEYEVKSNTNIIKYSVTLENQPEGCKITNIQNQEKNEFNSTEKFKILIPISNLDKAGNFKIKIKTEMETKPVFYGKSPNNSLQDYALTAYVCEDIFKEIDQEYIKNETQIIIEKQESETKENLQGAKFEILNENKKVIRISETDENGKICIEQLLPGTYYIKEIKAPDGYKISEDIQKIDIKMNEKITLKIENEKIKIKEEPVKEIPKLPVTGM